MDGSSRALKQYDSEEKQPLEFSLGIPIMLLTRQQLMH